MEFLPEYFLGAPTVAFIACTIALGIIAVNVGEKESPILFLLCAIPGWVIAQVYNLALWVFNTADWGKFADAIIIVSFWIGGIVAAIIIGALLFKFWRGIFNAYQAGSGVRRPENLQPDWGFIDDLGQGPNRQLDDGIPPNPNQNN